jgi:hypothetical protein
MNGQNMGASSGSREPSPAVSALSGFDPARKEAFDYIMPRLTSGQRAFILRMSPHRLEQAITQADWDEVEPKVDNDDPDGWPYWYWFGGMLLQWPAGRAAENPELTFRFNEVGLEVRAAIAMDARSGETAGLDPQGDSAGPQDIAHTGDPS